MTEARRIVVEEHPYNAEVPLAEIGKPAGEGALFVRTHFDMPALDAHEHRLQVQGEVRRPLALTLQDLRRWPARRLAVTFECAGNGRSLVDPKPPGTPWGLGAVGTAVFEGVALADVLEDAGLTGSALEVLASGVDVGKVASGATVAFERSLPTDVATGPDVLLAWGMNGAPLPPEHGYPLRLVVPGWYGVASVKWLVRLTALREPFAGWFQREHYVYNDEAGVPQGTSVGPMRVRSLITSPQEGAVLPRGAVQVRGAAWSGTPIVSVALSVDEGASWKDVELEEASDPWARRLWRHTWTPPGPGSYTLLARARDQSGALQPLQPIWNRQGYGNHAVHRVRVTVR